MPVQHKSELQSSGWHYDIFKISQFLNNNCIIEHDVGVYLLPLEVGLNHLRIVISGCEDLIIWHYLVVSNFFFLPSTTVPRVWDSHSAPPLHCIFICLWVVLIIDRSEATCPVRMWSSPWGKTQIHRSLNFWLVNDCARSENSNTVTGIGHVRKINLRFVRLI